MSHVVRTAVRRHSNATRATRAVLKELAEFAAHDGITWISQETLIEETTYSEREVRVAIRWLETNGEIETRKAQRGRRRINVYRVIVGPIGMTAPDYDRLPFTLVTPFSRPAEIAGRREGSPVVPAPATAGATPPLNDRQILPVADQVDDRQSEAPTTGSPTRTRGNEDPSLNHQTEEANASPVPADAGERARVEEQIRWALTGQLGATPTTRSEHGAWGKAIVELLDAGATADQVTARCAAYRDRWPSAVLTPIALVRHWSILGAHVEISHAERPLDRWLEISTQFDRETAHELLDDRPGVDPETRARYHQLLDARFDERQVA